MEVEPRLVPLFRRSFAGIEVLTRETPANPRLFEADLVVQASLFDLAAVFRHRPEDCTGALPLRVDEARAAALRARYRQGQDMPLVGVPWSSGNREIGAHKGEIGRASLSERVCQNVKLYVLAVQLKKKKPTD